MGTKRQSNFEVCNQTADNSLHLVNFIVHQNKEQNKILTFAFVYNLIVLPQLEIYNRQVELDCTFPALKKRMKPKIFKTRKKMYRQKYVKQDSVTCASSFLCLHWDKKFAAHRKTL